MTKDRVWTLERLVRYPLITDLDISPDGEEVVYSVREPLLTDEESKFIHHLYRVATSGEGEPLRLTYGEASNEMPRWSPDGRYIAFLSDRKGVKNLYVMRAEGGEAWPLTNVEKDIQSFAWSPDGRQLAFVMVPPDSPE
ncbi:MAG: PD40 domain-containing protein, partial [Anaerolineae bacterium]|nr:PD40 domain-containing protein [Anaerolineae bacterium]